MSEISVILNVYKRPETLEAQINSILKQSIKVKPENIHVWYNESGVEQFLPENGTIKTYECNWNTKFHGRFVVPLLLNTEYIAIFDDDVLPNVNWFKNCLDSMMKQEGIYGSSGVFLTHNAYAPNTKYGYNGIHNNNIVRVDLVGHGWFFKQKWAKYLWYEEPIDRGNGEDIMFSYLCQKHGGINTFVPPHPDNDQSLWGSDLAFGYEVGSDVHASWRLGSHLEDRGIIVRTCVMRGWKLARLG